MSESMRGMKRTHHCGDLRASHVGEEVVVCGWVQRRRELGGLIFVTVRDRTGLIQLNFDAERDAALFDKAASLRSEFVVAARGVVAHRGEGAVNHKMPTGEVEIVTSELRILAEAETTPFEIVDNTNAGDEIRLKYRYLDLRRPELQQKLFTRSKIAQCARRYFDEQGFIEVETPTLIKSTPEGARDYLVPSRVHPGSFYALPQSPQIYKQLLMLSGFDRYIQLARCWRDEDLRADRQPEFTQIDMELSFADEEDVIAVNEGFLKTVFKEVLGIDLAVPFRRLSWHEARARFGSDKPDLRFGLEIHDYSDAVRGCGFKVFESALEAGGSVRGIKVEGGAKMPRKEIDSLGEFVKTYRARGLAWYKKADTVSSSFAKFLSPEALEKLLTAADVQDGDLLLLVADAKDAIVLDALGALRLECARRLGLAKKGDWQFLWVTDFPMFEYSEEEDRYVAMHHPFTAPREEDMDKLLSDPGSVLARAYDIVLNGVELGGGSVRIHDRGMQKKVFEALGFTEEDAQARFGFLLDAFRFGAPPHAGLAYGLDRLVMLMTGAESLREVIAFPKVQNASELMSEAPSPVEQAQLDDLSIRTVEEK